MDKVKAVKAQLRLQQWAEAHQEPAHFKKLEVQSPLPGMQAAVIIHLPQAIVEVTSGIDQQTVEAVLMALKSVC